AVTAQTLLKLVGLLYSGELEVKSCEEQNDMLAAAHRFGISDLALGCGDEGRKGEELLERRERVRTEEGTELHKSVKMQDAQVQAEMSGRTDDDPHVKGKSFVSVGTQTVNSSLMSAASPGHLCDQATLPALQCVSSIATVSISLQPENITQFSFASYPTIHSDPESTAWQSSDCLTYPSFPSASSRYIETLPTSLKADARSPRSHKKNNCKQSPKSGESVSDQHRSGQEDGNANADGGTSAQLRGVCRERILGGEKEKKNSHFIGRGKNLEKMKQTQQVMKTAQIPFKVKLKRRAKGELWKIVGLQDADETVSVLTTIKRVDTHGKYHHQKTHSAHSVLPAHNPEFQTVQPVFTSSPQPLHHASLSSDSEARSNSCFSMNQSHELESESLSPPPGPVEESDEQIDKLLEDIMMSLNILPDLDKNCKKTQANHNGVPTFCQGPAAEDGAGVTPLHADVSAAGFYQDLETHGGHSTTDTAGRNCSTLYYSSKIRTLSSYLFHMKVKHSQLMRFPYIQLWCRAVTASQEVESKKRRKGWLREECGERGDPATTVCSVSFSCNNVPIKESGKTIGSLNKPHTATGTETSKGAANLGTEQTRIRTRGFMKRSQQNTSNTISDKCCVLIPVIGRAVVVQKQDPALPKRKRGRPPKIKLEQNLPEGVRANAEIKGCKKAGEKVSEKETPKEERKKGRKLMVNASEEEAGQLLKTTSPERPGQNETNNIKSNETQKQSWKVTMKEFQKLIICKDFKTRKATEVKDGNDSVDIEELEKVREAADEADTEAEMRRVLCDSTFDENHNLLLDTSAAQWKPTQQDVTGSSETRRSSVSGHGKKPASCPDVLEEEMVMLSSNREQGNSNGV
ncbi:hypothetical protein GOODEAATRI_011491, partial [Goodea atripinnis]